MKKAAKKQAVLIAEQKYQGRYVIFDSAQSDKIIASGTNPAKLIKKARDKGISVPAIVFVPKKNVICAY